MATPRCPGQNLQYWEFADIYNINCPFCDHEIEFWKDEPLRICPNCREEVRNTKMDLGCAKWCKFAEDCIGKSVEQNSDSVIDRLTVLIKRQLNKTDKSLKRTRLFSEKAEKSATETAVSICIVKAGAMLLGAATNDDNTLTPLANERDILLQAGLDPESIEQITAITAAIIADKILPSPEFKIINELRKKILDT
ncbi:MAG: hypothetical protein L3J71_12835 [Victivallaceae bacterium]|nr:hypothetical protein [Victivallaceae bacterium]